MSNILISKTGFWITFIANKSKTCCCCLLRAAWAWTHPILPCHGCTVPTGNQEDCWATKCVTPQIPGGHTPCSKTWLLFTCKALCCTCSWSKNGAPAMVPQMKQSLAVSCAAAFVPFKALVVTCGVGAVLSQICYKCSSLCISPNKFMRGLPESSFEVVMPHRAQSS